MIGHWLSDVREWTRARLLAVARWLVWSPWRIGATVVVVALVLIVLAQVRGGDPAAAPSGPGSPRATAWPVATAGPNADITSSPTGAQPTDAAAGDATPTARSSSPVSETPAAELSGEKLGRAWIEAFLTRDDPDSTEWVDEVRPWTTPDLLDTLQDEGAETLAVPIDGPWRVGDVTPYTPPDPIVDTPSRVQLAYRVTITNGEQDTTKPFVLTAYRGNDGWRVAFAEQPYTSNG